MCTDDFHKNATDKKRLSETCISPELLRIGIDFMWFPDGWSNDQVNRCRKNNTMKGPLVYCLEEKENSEFLSKFLWDYFDRRKRSHCKKRTGRMLTLSYKGIRVRNKGADGENQLYGSVELEKEEVSLRAVHYYVEQPGDREMLVWHKLRI